MRNLLESFRSRIGQRGSSLVQVLVAAAVVGGASVVLMNQQQLSTKQAKTAVTNMAVIDLQEQIHSLLLSEEICTASFEHVTLAPGGAVGINNLRDRLGKVLFQRNQDYSNGQVRITDMNLRRVAGDTAEFTVRFLKKGIEDGRGFGAVDSQKKFDISVNWDTSTNKLLSCYSAFNNAIDTAVEKAIQKFCPETSDPSSNGLYFSDPFCEAVAQLGKDNAPLGCGPNESIRSINYDPTTRTYTPVCEPIYNMPATCEKDSFLRRKPDGTFDCVKMACQQNEIFLGLDTDGWPRCLACGIGEVAISVNGEMACRSTSCAKSSGGLQQYFAGFDAYGNKICRTLIDGSDMCPRGGRLVATPGGQIKYECCTQNCSAAANVCSNTAFPEPNGCGVCNGAKTPSCGDTSNYCVGQTYPSANGCGNCEGTKPPTPGTWTDWVATSETRVKPGASCDCALKQKAMQRKYVRTCHAPTCGGAPCYGSTEEWRDEGVETCNEGCGLHYFFTAKKYNANLGGQAGADLKCNTDPNRDPTKVYQANLGDHCRNWNTSSTGGWGTSGCRYPYTGPWVNEEFGNEGLYQAGPYYFYTNSMKSSSVTYWHAYHFYTMTGPTTNCNNWTTSGECPAGTKGACATRKETGGAVGTTNSISGYIQACSEMHSILCIEKLSAASCSPVHGGWSDWMPWDDSSCTSGYGGTKHRRRYCNNPYPSCGGNICGGADDYLSEHQSAPCP